MLVPSEITLCGWPAVQFQLLLTSLAHFVAHFEAITLPLLTAPSQNVGAKKKKKKCLLGEKSHYFNSHGNFVNRQTSPLQFQESRVGIVVIKALGW